MLARSTGNGSTWTSHAYYHADGNGNVTCLVDASQSVVASYRYDPFGNTLTKTGTLADANLCRFSSKELHAKSGMYYYLYRFYDPNLQRWINRDPLGDIGSLVFALRTIENRKSEIPSRRQFAEVLTGNLFSFVGNQPVVRLDAWGLIPKPGDIKWCNKALKLLKQYERLAQKQKKCLPRNRLDELDRKRDNGTITSNDLPGSLKSEFPSCFEGMTLSEIEEFCP